MIKYSIHFIGLCDGILTSARENFEAADLGDVIAKASGMMRLESATRVKDSNDVVWTEFVVHNYDNGVIVYYSNPVKNEWLKQMKEVFNAH